MVRAIASPYCRGAIGLVSQGGWLSKLRCRMMKVEREGIGEEEEEARGRGWKTKYKSR